MNTMDNPLVSVLIPVFNAGEYLRPAVLSVIGQSYRNLEIILIDDGSTDGCIENIADVEDARVKVLRQENQGKSVAMNLALEAMSGDFYAIQDADDLSAPMRIERQLGAMLAHPEVAAVFCGYDIILGGRQMAPRFAAKGVEECEKDIESMRMPSHDPTVMFRVSMVDGLRYEPELRIGQGFDYILRVGEMWPMLVLGECLYSYRIHESSVTRRDARRRRMKVQMVRDRAARRRGLVPTDPDSGEREGRHADQEHGVVTHFMESVLSLRRAGSLRRALTAAWQCLALHPADAHYYKPLIYALAPMGLIRRYRDSKFRDAQGRQERRTARAS